MNATFKAISRDEARHAPHRECNGSQAFPSRTVVHAKLEMTTPGDQDEQEADEMADSIVNGGKIARSVSSGHSGSGIALPSQFGSQLASFQGQGSRLNGDLKSQMESGFGRDFSDVRIHTGNAAAEMSNSIYARAFTYGNDIYFNRGQFNPETRDGRHLIAHELTHVVQENGKVGRRQFGDRYNYNEQFVWNNCSYRFYSEDKEGQNVLILERRGSRELKAHDQFWFTLDFKNGEFKGSSKSFHITKSTHHTQKKLN